MSYLFSLDLSKLKKNYWKIYHSSSDVTLDVSTFASLYPNNSEEKIEFLSDSKLVLKGPSLGNYGMTTQTAYGKNLKSSNPKFNSFTQNLPKLGILKITSKKGLSEAQVESITDLGAWAYKQNFIIKASKYKTNYGNEKKYGKTTKYSGNNLFLGSSESEKVFAGNGNDKIYGKNGNDKLFGESGNDLLVGGKGKDKLIGGKGKDIFKLSTGKGYDLIQDFKNKQDKIYIGSMKKIKLKNKGNDVLIYKGKDLLAKVKGAKGDLSIKGKYFI